MVACLIVGDIHLSDKAPSSRKSDYTELVLGKLNFAAALAAEKNLPLILAGDVFHIKTASKNSHKLVQATHQALDGVRTFIVPGNHDMSGDRLDSLDKQPLGALARMHNVSLLIGEDPELPGVAGVPYITEFDGGDWERALSEKWNNFDIEAAIPTLIVTHAPIFPNGQAPGVYASITPDEWAEYWMGIVATYYGHIHDYHGTFMDSHSYMQFCNQGALSRGSLHESSIQRAPGITLWDGDNFNRIEVPHKPASEVFLFEKAQRVAENKASAAEFAEALGSTQIPILTLDAVIDTIRNKGTDKRVLTVIEEVLEEVQ